MRIVAELVPRREARSLEIREAGTGLDLLTVLDLAPDAHLLVRDDVPIPLDEPLEDGETIRVIAVVSGGGA
ncbi:MAG: hypothetical protein ACT4OI_02175 [Methanobacteriota archaeon]